MLFHPQEPNAHFFRFQLMDWSQLLRLLTFHSKIKNINLDISENTNSRITQLHQCEDKDFTDSINSNDLDSTIEEITDPLDWF